MKPVKLIASVSTIAILGLLAANVGAQQTNVQERTFMTFSTAVEMPGVVLEPGTYEFQLADSPQRNVIQVFTKDRTDVIGQWTFVPSQRERVSDETVVMFRETAEGTTPAVQYWYFPGEKVGKEFIYPKDQAERIAARTGQQVRTEEGVIGSEQRAEAGAAAEDGAAPQAAPAASATATAAPGAQPAEARAAVDAEARADVDVDADGVEAEARVAADEPAQAAGQQPSSAAQPTAAAGSTTGNRGVAAAGSERVEAEASVTAQQPQPRASAPAPATQPETQIAARQPSADEPRPVGTSGAAQQPREADVRAAGELPRTASPLALAGLMGLLSLAGAFGVRRFYR